MPEDLIKHINKLNAGIDSTQKRLDKFEITIKRIPEIEKKLSKIDQIDTLNEKLDKLEKYDKSKDLQQVLEKINTVSNDINYFKSISTNFELLVKDLLDKSEKDRKEIDELNKENAKQKREFNKLISDLEKEKIELREQIDKILAGRPTIKFEELTNHFKKAIKNLNTQENNEKYSVSIENIEAEIKCGLDVDEDLKITQVLPAELNNESLSTLKFTIKPLTNIKIVND